MRSRGSQTADSVAEILTAEANPPFVGQVPVKAGVGTLNPTPKTMKRTASAVWNGTLKQGAGTLTTDSAVLDSTPFSFRSRFEEGTETNPEELIAAAHAGCFSMALSLFLEQAGSPPETIRTRAILEMDAGKLEITAIHLELTAKVPGMDAATFEEAANKAKANCPVSKVLKADITLDAKLEE